VSTLTSYVQNPNWQDNGITWTLHVAVPQLIDQLRALDEPRRNRVIREWADECSAVFYPDTDVLMYGGGQPGQVASVMGYLARGIAALAWAGGGVTFAGQHWCAEPHPPLPCPNGRASAGEAA
jgi:hypothetical protein